MASGFQAAAVAAANAAAGAAESGRAAMLPAADTARRRASSPAVSGLGLFLGPRTALPDDAPTALAAAEVGARKQEAGVQGMDAGTLQLGRALHALQRSAAAVLADQLGPSGSRPPPEWGPLAGGDPVSIAGSKEALHGAVCTFGMTHGSLVLRLVTQCFGPLRWWTVAYCGERLHVQTMIASPAPAHLRLGAAAELQALWQPCTP